jgi:hypothetical protein
MFLMAFAFLPVVEKDQFEILRNFFLSIEVIVFIRLLFLSEVQGISYLSFIELKKMYV